MPRGYSIVADVGPDVPKPWRVVIDNAFHPTFEEADAACRAHAAARQLEEREAILSYLIKSTTVPGETLLAIRRGDHRR